MLVTQGKGGILGTRQRRNRDMHFIIVGKKLYAALELNVQENIWVTFSKFDDQNGVVCEFDYLTTASEFDESLLNKVFVVGEE
jgi:hypothetical protein